MKYTVSVDDNFHYQNESDRYVAGEFDSCEKAVAFAKGIVDRCLEHFLDKWLRQTPNETPYSPDAFYKYYTAFGEDPFIVSEGEKCEFSAWTYAKQRCDEIIQTLNAEYPQDDNATI